MKRRWSEFLSALTLLTRLPVSRMIGCYPRPGDCVWAYPPVGVVVGGLGALTLWLAAAAGISRPVAAVLALAATALVTGALHEDGLADTADGFGGGRTREAKLAIMRDSRIGSFGALALMLSLALRGAALATTPRPIAAMMTAAVLGRAAMLIPLLQSPARVDGLAADLSQTSRGTLVAGLLLAAPLAGEFSAAALAAGAAALGMALLARRQVGGYTGDVLGAAEQVAEIAALICF